MNTETISLGGDLAEIRNEIDRIDDEIFTLLHKRTAFVRQIGRIKNKEGSKNPLRPAREAQILRRLLSYQKGGFPALSLVHIFREIVAAHCKTQGNFAIAYTASEDEALIIRDLIRFYYGASTTLTAYRSASQVLQSISKYPGMIGILPSPEVAGQTGFWWLNLAHGDSEVSIVGRIPFIITDNHAEKTINYVVANTVLQPSGDDISFLVVVTPSEISRTTVTSLMSEIGYSAHTIAVHDDLQSNVRHHLIEVSGYIDKQEQDDIKDKFMLGAGGKVLSLRLIGVMPHPIQLENEEVEGTVA